MVSASDLRRLLDSDKPGATLVLEEGALRVLSSEELHEQSMPLKVISGSQLREQMAEEGPITDEGLTHQATILDQMVREQGA